MRIEEEHMDVLQNVESVVASHYQSHPDMTDYAVTRVYEALTDAYVGEKIGRQPRAWNPTELEQELFEAVKGICEWRLGRQPELVESPDGVQSPSLEEIDVETLLLCLKRLGKSVPKWTKRSGRQGYLNFMSRFVG